MGLWIMPWGLFALILMPLGLESIALVPMGAGIELVDGIARFVAGLPGSRWTTPPAAVWALVSTGLGGLFLCLW
jgi:competence protein ComEC